MTSIINSSFYSYAGLSTFLSLYLHGCDILFHFVFESSSILFILVDIALPTNLSLHLKLIRIEHGLLDSFLKMKCFYEFLHSFKVFLELKILCLLYYSYSCYFLLLPRSFDWSFFLKEALMNFEKECHQFYCIFPVSIWYR